MTVTAIVKAIVTLIVTAIMTAIVTAPVIAVHLRNFFPDHLVLSRVIVSKALPEPSRKGGLHSGRVKMRSVAESEHSKLRFPFPSLFSSDNGHSRGSCDRRMPKCENRKV